MKIFQILVLLFLGTVVSLLGVAAFFMFVSPADLSLWLFIVLYLLLYMSFLGTLTFFGVIFRVYLFRAKVPMKAFRRTFRQSCFLAFLGVVALSLSHFGLLSWATLAFLVIAVGVLEMFFLTSRSRKG